MNQSSLDAVMSSQVMDWCTPTSVLDPIYDFSPIGLDPCSNSDSIVKATTKLSLGDGTISGLEADWITLSGDGLVFVNPPYGPSLKQWTAKCHTEALFGCEIIALVPARTDTKWFHNSITMVSKPVICFWKGRIKFVGGKHCAPFPSMLVYWGPRKFAFAQKFQEHGLIVLV